MTENKYTAVVAILGKPDATLFGQPPYAATSDIFAWWTPVIDRTLSDCVYGNHKGCIDQVLLNRLEANTEYIKYKLDTLNFVSSRINKSSIVWLRNLYVKYSDIERIRSNIEKLRNSGIIFDGTPIPQKILGCERPGYELINEWERVLYDINVMLTAVQHSKLYTAQPLLYSGFAIYTYSATNEGGE